MQNVCMSICLTNATHACTYENLIGGENSASDEQLQEKQGIHNSVHTCTIAN